jgi:hypothetical protein
MIVLIRQKYITGLFLIIAACFLGQFNCFGQEKDIPKELYTSAGIPDSLKEDAHSVVRYSMENIEVKGPGKLVSKVHYIVTILDEKGDDQAEISLPYNRKFETVSSFEMIIYDADGKQVKKYHKSDMYDHADEDDEMLLSDDRSMSIRHTVSSYPTTVEMIFELDDNSVINLNQWDIQGEDQSVQNSYFDITINSDAGFRYLDKNTSLKPVKTSTDKTDTYSWQASNLKAIKMEEGAMPWRVLPKVELAMDKFEFYGYPGDFTSWQNFGKWQQALNADVCTLSPQRVAEIQQMTANLKTDKEKAKFLYNYLQQNTRYVAIKLGIGGLKPFPADFVDQKKYGDCKALTNYMVALLKAVNIKAYYAIVNAGSNEEPQEPSFPYDISDHIICCIPFKNDTTWLECTNNQMPFGTLGAFTENRNALLITEDGGKLVNTPKSKAEENQFNSEVHLVLDTIGGAKAQVKFMSTGEYRMSFIGLAAAKNDEQKEALLRAFNFKQPSAFDIKPGTDNDGVKEVDLDLEYDKFCDIAVANKQFYKPHVFDLCGMTVPILDKRKSDYYFEWPEQTSCVTTIDLPKGFEIETLPANQSLKFTYGTYQVNYTYDAVKNQVISTAKFNLNSQVIPAAKYNELQQYLDAVAKAQNKKLVIRRKA